MTSLVVVIPSRDLHGILRACVGAVRVAFSATELLDECQIVVVDNASTHPYTDRDVDPAVVVRFDTHKGFSFCCNAGSKISSSDYLLFLNNDVLLAPESIGHMIATMQMNNAGIVGTLLEFPDGTVQHAGVGFPSETPVNLGRGRESQQFLGRVMPVPAVTGAAMLVNRLTFSELGGFDERYAFGHEDVDLCLRARDSGFTVWLDGRSRSVHFESLTPGRTAFEEESRMTFLRTWEHRLSIQEGLS
jgi:GT2 family glycosyltransferase